MFSFAKKATLATALVASALASASPAMAHDYYDRRGGGDTAGAAIAGGIIGLALGAIIVSSSNKHRHGHDYRDYRDGQYYGYNRYNNGYYRDYRNYRGYDGDRDYYDRRGYDRRDYGEYRHGY